jgi:hypothetical protein
MQLEANVNTPGKQRAPHLKDSSDIGSQQLIDDVDVKWKADANVRTSSEVAGSG